MKKIVLIMGQYSAKAQKFQETLHRAGIECSVVVLEDDGFLPGGVISPYEYYILKQNKEVHREKKVHYNFLKIPEFWEIRPYGEICDMGRKKASVVCTEPSAKGIVQKVKWQMDDGWIYKIDYYNKCGLRFASEFIDRNHNIESKVYYSDDLQEVIVEQPQNDIVTLLEKGKVSAFFTSYRSFLVSFFDEVNCSGDYVLFLEREENIPFLNRASNENDFWKCVVFQNKVLLKKYTDEGGRKGILHYEVPVSYPVNRAEGEVLILTASDQIAGIEDLIEGLPDINFHIAANTLVSDKLYSLQKWENVKIYPQIGGAELEKLWQKCDFYLDINYYWEIYDAVDEASRRNLLILGFTDTLHRRELVAKECIFSGQDYEGMIRLMKDISYHSENMLIMLGKQQERRSSAGDGLKKMLESKEN